MNMIAVNTHIMDVTTTNTVGEADIAGGSSTMASCGSCSSL